jgi:DNA processing protein
MNDMNEEDIGIVPHHIFLGLIQLNGIGFQTLYNFCHEGKHLSDLMMTENLDEFTKLLGRSFDTNAYDVNDWKFFLNYIIDLGINLSSQFAKNGITFLLASDYQFPKFPENMKKPIYWLFIEGKVKNLYIYNSLALIGSRESSSIGSFLAHTLLFGASCVKEKLVTISGLAAGIDQIVHEISLFLDIPTIAVLGNGLNENYPINSTELRRKIINSGGTIITEYFPNMKPSKESFVNRNRIQAALARTVIPLEWKEKSGTAHTIRYANEMDKQVLYVETNQCRKNKTDHSIANHKAQIKYGGEIFLLPNAINDLISKLDLQVNQPTIITSENNGNHSQNKDFKQPQQIGLDF